MKQVRPVGTYFLNMTAVVHTVCLFTMYLLPFIVFFSREYSSPNQRQRRWTEHSLEHSWKTLCRFSSPSSSWLSLFSFFSQSFAKTRNHQIFPKYYSKCETHPYSWPRSTFFPIWSRLQISWRRARSATKYVNQGQKGRFPWRRSNMFSNGQLHKNNWPLNVGKAHSSEWRKRRLASVGSAASHVQRLRPRCGRPGLDCRPAVLRCVSLPLSHPVSCPSLQLNYQ